MRSAADSLEAAGFVVPDRRSDADVGKLVGYEAERSPARLRLPLRKAAVLAKAMLHISRCPTLECEQLRAVIGVWVWAALLRRDVLAAPATVFERLETHEGRRARLWPSVRRELRAMASLLRITEANLGARLPGVIFATDAMGADLASQEDTVQSWRTPRSGSSRSATTWEPRSASVWRALAAIARA